MSGQTPLPATAIDLPLLPLRDVVVGTLRYETAEESLQEKPVADAVQVSA